MKFLRLVLGSVLLFTFSSQTPPAVAVPDTSLRALTITVDAGGSGTWLAPFDSASATSAFEMPFLATSISVYALANSDSATVRLVLETSTVDSTQSSLSAPNLPLSVVPAVLTMEVTNDSVTSTYSVNITRAAASAVNTLSALSISSGSGNLLAGFDANVDSYTVNTAYGVSSLTITPTRSDANSSNYTISVNSGSDSRTVNGVPLTFSPIVGSLNTVSINVAAQSGAIRNYSISIIRAAALTLSTLDSLTVTNNLSGTPLTLNPNFGSQPQNIYAVDLTSTTDSVTVTPALAPSKFASYQISVARAGETSVVTSGPSSPLSFMPLVGDNTVVVRAIAQDGVTQSTYTITFRKPANNIPATPTAPVVLAGDKSVAIYVVPLSSSPAATSFRVNIYNNLLTFVNTCTITGASGSCVISGLTNGASYVANAQAFNGTYTSALSPYSTAVIPSALPSPPTKPVVTAGNGSIAISVGNAGTGSIPTRIDVTGYTSANAVVGSCTINGASGSCTISGLNNATQYKFDAVSINAQGFSTTRSPMSDLISPVGVPIAPVQPTVTAGDGEVTVTVAALAAGSPAASFIVTANPNSGGKTCTITGSSGSCKISGLSNGTRYTFSAVAINAAGTSPASASTATVTPVAAPRPSPSPTPTPSSSPSPTPTPSPTITPQVSPSPRPSALPAAKLRVLFAANSATLSKLAIRQLDTMLSKITESVVDIRVQADGNIVNLAVTSKERSLSLKRAQVVARYLQREGLYGTYKVRGGVVASPQSAAKNSVSLTVFWSIEK